MDGLMNKVRQAVSKKKRRYQQDGYDLDLTYIKNNLIAMGFPAQTMEGLYRNHMDEVVRFLEEKHAHHYRVYNLCAERTYDEARFHNRVVHFPFTDHNPPKIELMEPFCRDLDQWLGSHKDNVAVVHCKAGKGRTGVMICAYLLHTRIKKNAEQSLEFYAQTRTVNAKGVTIPSQRRYVHYYEQLLKREPSWPYQERHLLLQGIKLRTIPKLSNLAIQIVIAKCSSSSTSLEGSAIAKCYESSFIEIQRADGELCLEFPEKIPLAGDILITFNNKPKPRLRKEKMFRFWFNTFFVTEKAHGLLNGKSKSVMMCAMADNPKYTGDPAKLRRWSSLGSPDAVEKKLRAAQSFQFIESNCLVLPLKKPDLDKANKDRSHKIYQPDFEVVCYFEEPKAGDVAGSASSPSMVTIPSESEVATEQDDDLSDTDTDEEAQAC